MLLFIHVAAFFRISVDVIQLPAQHPLTFDHLRMRVKGMLSFSSCRGPKREASPVHNM